jgi:hypothetical protein
VKVQSAFIFLARARGCFHTIILVHSVDSHPPNSKLYSAKKHKEKKEKLWYPPFQAPLCFHRLHNPANTGKLKLSQRLVPDPLDHWLGLWGVQVGGETIGRLLEQKGGLGCG